MVVFLPPPELGIFPRLIQVYETLGKDVDREVGMSIYSTPYDCEGFCRISGIVQQI